MEYQQPQFFRRGPSAFARLSFFSLASIMLMVLDARFHYAEPLRQTLAWTVYPLQQVAIAPVTAFNHVSDFFSSQSALREQNAELRNEQLTEAERLLTLESVQAENEQLRALLEVKARQPSASIAAEIIYAGRDPFSRKVIIDKGLRQGIEPGRPVIDTAGVIGQVTRVLPLLAEVTLLTDKGQAIPVQVLRNGMRGIAYGSGDGSTLELRFMPANAEVQAGDMLVTSGLDNLYPRGLPVARVAKVERDAAYAFAKISLTPIAGTNQHRQVLVLSKGENKPPYPYYPAPDNKKTPQHPRLQEPQ
jgi:rod shape-determining protein MreC